MPMQTRKEAIVMDVDQVLLDHLARFREWYNKKYGKNICGLPNTWDASDWLEVDSRETMVNLFTEFSKDFEFGTLDAFPGADVVLHELLREGYTLICLTACGSHDVTQALRKANLFHRFGDIFTEVHFTEMTESKADKLNDIGERYDIVAFIDDKPENIEDAFWRAEIDNCILMKAPHNRNWRENNLTNADHAFGWYECKRIINGYSQAY